MVLEDSGKDSGHSKEALLPPDMFLPKRIIESKSEPNSRSGSFKRKTRVNSLMEEDRQRNSLSISTEKALSGSYSDISDKKWQLPRRVRSFRTPSKGFATPTERDRRESNISLTSLRGLNRKVLSSETPEECATRCRFSSACSTGYYRVCIMGADAVGKRTLTSQFISSELISSDVFEKGDVDDNMLSVVIDSEESTLEFVDFPENEADRFPVDAFIIVFSVHERTTYDVAIQYLQYVRNKLYSDRPIIPVANKVDLVRKRRISNDEARNLASKFNCKYIETSATLNHHVDELLLGILKQIKLRLCPDIPENTSFKSNGASIKRLKELLKRLFHLKQKVKV